MLGTIAEALAHGQRPQLYFVATFMPFDGSHADTPITSKESCWPCIESLFERSFCYAMHDEIKLLTMTRRAITV